MSKISSVLLICLFVYGMMCIQQQNNQYSEKQTSNQNLNNIEVQKVKPIRKSLIMEEDAQEVGHQDESTYPKASIPQSSETSTSKKTLKSSTILNSHRLLSDDYNDYNDNNSQDNDYSNDNDWDNSYNENSNCAPGRCQTCVNNSCTQCKLDQYGQEKYLLVNGRCYESDNHTNDDRHEVDSNEKWDDHENYHEEGQVSYGGRKYKCQAGCKVCNSTADITKCTTCMDGFSLNSTVQKCMRCDDKCVTCSSGNLQNCTSCYPGWTLDGPDALGKFTCSKCAADHCGQCDTLNNCTKCKNFYYRLSETTCESCLQNCRICQNSSSCQQCFSGYFLTEVEGAQSCVICASGCASCSSLTDCVKCYPGYLMNTNTKVCERCSSNCWQCSSPSVCTRCVQGYQLLNNACVSYIEDCAVMNTDNTCKQCFEGYLLNNSNTQCIENEAHDDHVCGQNQYLLNRTCQACGVTVQNCQKCNNDTCLKCTPEYFREQNGTTCTLCRSAMAGCKKCDNSIFCSRCADGYFMEQDRNGSILLSYGNCIKCDANCLTCNQKGIYCTSCNSGYSLSTARTCVPTNQFDFTLLLNLDLNLFPSKISQFKSQLAKLIQDSDVSYKEKQNYVQITKIASGSILVTGTIAASSPTALQSTKSTFDNKLATGSTFSDIQVLSSNSDERDNDNDNDGQDGEDDDQSSSSTGMIVGIVVGIVVAVIVIAVVAYFFCCKKTVQQTQDINLDEKKSRSTVDDLVASQMIQQSYETNQIHVNNNSNPQRDGPQYFV